MLVLSVKERHRQPGLVLQLLDLCQFAGGLGIVRRSFLLIRDVLLVESVRGLVTILLHVCENVVLVRPISHLNDCLFQLRDVSLVHLAYGAVHINDSARFIEVVVMGVEDGFCGLLKTRVRLRQS